jgi:hypothetical protein
MRQTTLLRKVAPNACWSQSGFWRQLQGSCTTSLCFLEQVKGACKKKLRRQYKTTSHITYGKGAILVPNTVVPPPKRIRKHNLAATCSISSQCQVKLSQQPVLVTAAKQFPAQFELTLTVGGCFCCCSGCQCRHARAGSR